MPCFSECECGGAAVKKADPPIIHRDGARSTQRRTHAHPSFLSCLQGPALTPLQPCLPSLLPLDEHKTSKA